MRENFISSKYKGKTHTIYVWSDNVNIMWGSDTDDIIRELLGSLLKNYKRVVEWLLHQKATIIRKNKNYDECLRWLTISALNHNKIMKKEFENTF